ncbi:MAG: T9SS type A sorting domain-containing protein, partial [Bacteroidia bacterium]
EKIYLPDSNINEEESHGYLNFIYNLSVKTPLKIGTPIRNQAYIYFDYQEPILTNVARNLVSKVDAIKKSYPTHQLSVYPNPASDYIYINNPVNSSVQVDIINSFGQIILTKTIEANRKLSIATINMAKGLYMIRAEGYASVKIIVN